MAGKTIVRHGETEWKYFRAPIREMIPTLDLRSLWWWLYRRREGEWEYHGSYQTRREVLAAIEQDDKRKVRR